MISFNLQVNEHKLIISYEVLSENTALKGFYQEGRYPQMSINFKEKTYPVANNKVDKFAIKANKFPCTVRGGERLTFPSNQTVK